MAKQQITPGYYAVLPAEVRYDNDLSSGAKLLYAEITALANKMGTCFASNSYFSSLYGVDGRTIRRWICELEAKDYIAIDIKKSEANRRYIMVDIRSIVASQLNKKMKLTTDKNVHTLWTKMSTPYGHFCPAPINMNNSLNINNTRLIERDNSTVENIQNSSNPAPTLEAVKKYFADKKYTSDSEHFFNYYTAKGWPVMSWDKAADGWEKRDKKFFPAGEGKGQEARGTSGLCVVCEKSATKKQKDKNGKDKYLCDDHTQMFYRRGNPFRSDWGVLTKEQILELIDANCVICGKDGIDYELDEEGNKVWLCVACKRAFNRKEKRWGRWSRDAIAEVIDSVRCGH